MCGIVGYIGKEKHSSLLINALKQLEYRGYDSCGIVTNNGQEKKIGPPTSLTLDTNFKIGIGHTRWATHGSVSLENTHPIKVGNTYVVCNGIVENAKQLRKDVEQHFGCVFTSETDTEVIGHVFNQYLHLVEKSPDDALEATIDKLVGDFSFLLLHEDIIYFCCHGSPLNIYQMGLDGYFFASSDVEIDAQWVRRFKNGSCGVLYQNGCVSWTKGGLDDFIWHLYKPRPAELTKEGFDSYMHKEIFEQEKAAKKVIDNFKMPMSYMFHNGIKIIGCGSSYNAGLIGKIFFEEAGIPCSAEIASEFSKMHRAGELLIGLSQSGETADTLAAYRDYRGDKLSICNQESSMSRHHEQQPFYSYSFLTDVGEERGVASTKTFLAQIITLYLMAKDIYYDNYVRKGPHYSSRYFYEDINPEWLKPDLSFLDVDELTKFKKFAFIGSGLYYPLALEGALKFKELTYIPAQGYAAGEMKHGPLAIADEELCVFSLGDNHIADAELRARGAEVFTLFGNKLEDFFKILVQIQLTAMIVADKMGHDVDKPRNLAKSVTVR